MRVAAYARYSSDQQREASLEDQLRNCRAYCQRQGWRPPEPYTDAAISGSRGDRPGYRRLMTEAAAGAWDVILVDDLSRLSRDAIECQRAVRELTFAGVRLIGVSDGVDTGRKSHKADVGLRGLMSELYLDDLAEKTHRGLAGRALAGASAGGLAYGYRITTVGQREIDPSQAAVVRRIFADYLAGHSPREIASRLNSEGIPSARGGTWAMSAIRGDKRGIGILSNALYSGRQIWNRSRWIKHPTTGRRIRKERPESEWIIRECPELAIIDAATWDATQQQLRQRGGRQPGAERRGGPGRPPRYLLSGLVRCGTCGGPVVIVDKGRYGCNINKDRGPAACASALRVPRAKLEPALLSGIQDQLLTEAAMARMTRAVTDALKRAAPSADDSRKRLAEAERVHANIMAALRAGIITPSTRAELIAAEEAVAAARAELEARTSAPTQLLPRARESWRRIVADLADYARDIPAARQAIRDLLGESMVLKNENGAVFVEAAPSRINVVAGAGFDIYPEPFRVPITLR